MKIYSQKKDYYDSIQIYGSSDINYIRKEKEVYVKDRELSSVLGNIRYGSGKIIYFCGKFYPFVLCGYIPHDKEYRNGWNIKWFECIYDCEAYIDYVESKGNGLSIWENSKAKNFFNNNFNIVIPDDIPIAVIEQVDNGFIRITFNDCNLKFYKFQTIKNPYSAYQEIEMFLSNVARPEPKICTISDKERIVKAGFDTKVSFRKRKV